MPDARVIGANELIIGDIINPMMADDYYSDATVINIETIDDVKYATLFRPYVHVGDTAYSKGLIPYIGFEQYKIAMRENSKVSLKLRVQKDCK